MIKEYISNNQDRFLSELFDWLRIPSISADRKYKDDVRKAAEFLKIKLEQAGADSGEICETSGHPIVYAEKMVNPSLPTALHYGHYDVQPLDPLVLWTSPPFDHVDRSEQVYARGACRDKA